MNALVKPEPQPAIALGGTWRSDYNWTEGGGTVQSTPEEVVLAVSGQEVTGQTTTSNYPYRLTAKIQDSYLLGQTVSLEKSFKLRSVFVLKLDVDTERKLQGRWIGTGNQMYYGDWTLTKVST